MTWRAIQDSAPISESLSSISRGAEALFWRIVSRADAWGCLAGTARKVKGECVPLVDCSVEDVRDWLDELKRAGRVARHRNGTEYIELVDWDANQPTEQIRRRGPSRFLHPTGVIPADETRPCDRRKGKRAKAENGSTMRGAGISNNRALETETETETETDQEQRTKGRRAREGSSDDLSIGLPNPIDSVAVLLASLRHADRNTERVLRKLALPEAAYRAALEALNEMRAKRKAPTNDAAWVVSRLKDWRS